MQVVRVKHGTAWHALDIELSKIYVTAEVLSIRLYHGNTIDTPSRGRDSNVKHPLRAY